MRRLRFLVTQGHLDAGTGSVVQLPDDEAHHLRTTLRARPGMEVSLFDGTGREFLAEITGISRHAVEARLGQEETRPVESPLRLVLYQAVSRDESFEAVIGAATALGVGTIVPVLVERAKAGARPPDAKRLARWRRIAREEAKLSWRRLVPGVAEPVGVDGISVPSDPGTLAIVLDPEAPAGTLRTLLDGPRYETIFVAVGPEGGFSGTELDRFLESRFRPVALGPRILRTQHAGPAALALLQARWGDIQ